MTQRASESLVAVLIRIGLLLALAIMLMAENAQAQTPPSPGSAAPLTEETLRARYTGKMLYLRGHYLGDDLTFDSDGKVLGSPAAGSFTLSALEIKKVKLTKHKLELEADRYGLHFLGGLPYQEENKSYDKVKISKKPIHIAIEMVAVPKLKKKEKPAPGATVDSSAALSKALDNVFASDIDARMLAGLPDYWQEYFRSKSQHQQYMPADAAVRPLSEGMTAPKVLNSLDPTSNEYAQEFGIAGIEMLRTVVDAKGVPQQMAIDRPIGFGLDEKAAEAVKKSRFRPATLNGQPVPVVIDLMVTFRIYSDGTKPGQVVNSSVLAASLTR